MARIMIVDDDKNLRALYMQEFEDDGYDIMDAADGAEALRRMEEVRPDLVIVDIAMPGMDGIELLNRILAIDKSIPIVLNTAYANYKDNFMTWSADAYVVKSGNLCDLKERVKNLLFKKGDRQRDLDQTAGIPDGKTKEGFIEIMV